MIDKTKQGAIINSAYGYLDAIDKFNITSLTDNPEFELNGTYIIEDGKLGDYEIPFSGNAPITGRLTYKNNDFINGIIQYDAHYVLIYGKETKVINVPKNNSDGLYASSLEMDKGRYLYRGKNPNNWLLLKENDTNVMYRIISYEKDGTIKVVRNNSIGTYAWDYSENRNDGKRAYCNSSFGCNAWGNSFNTFYNEKVIKNTFYYKYYNNETTNVLSTISGETVNKDSSLNTYLNSDWIEKINEYNYLTSHFFDVGSIFYSNNYSGGNKGLQKEKEEQSLFKWYGFIGLINITDMVESSLDSNCYSVYNSIILSTNREINCTKKNYLYRGHEWTMTPCSALKTRAWGIEYRGFFGYFDTTTRDEIRPTFFLRSDSSFIGEGTKDHPYIIENF